MWSVTEFFILLLKDLNAENVKPMFLLLDNLNYLKTELIPHYFTGFAQHSKLNCISIPFNKDSADKSLGVSIKNGNFCDLIVISKLAA